MLTLPAPYPEALRSAFGWGAEVEVLGAGLIVPITNGSVVIASDAQVTRSLSIDIAGEDFGRPVAQSVFNAIYTYGGVLKATAILKVPGVADHRLPLGEFQVQKVGWARERGDLRVEALGRASLLEDDRFEAPRTLASGSAVARLTGLLQETLPGVALSLGAGISDRTLVEATYDEDRLAACRDIAVAMNGYLFEKGDGSFEVRARTGATVDLEGVTLTRDVQYERAKTYNGVRAVGTHQDFPGISAWAKDTLPGSPTLWGGPFGKKPRFYASPVLTTVAQAQAAADSLLARSIGHEFGLSLTAVQNPAVEPGDVFVTTIDGVSKTQEITKVTLPLAVGGSMGLETSAVA